MSLNNGWDRDQAQTALASLKSSLPESEGEWEFDPTEPALVGDPVGLLRLALRIGTQALEPKQDEFGTQTISLSDEDNPLYLTVRSNDEPGADVEPPKGVLWGCGLIGGIVFLLFAYLVVLGIGQLLRQLSG